MKSYISSGKTEVHNLEIAALENQPPLFHEYGVASTAEKNIMDIQLRDLKTNARLQSKSGWHNWRSQLLDDLKRGLLQTSLDLDQDDKLLVQAEKAFENILPSLLLREKDLEQEVNVLEERKQDAEENTGAEIKEARTQLLALETELNEKEALLESLKSDLESQQSSLEDARSWRAENVAAIGEADRITEEYRGWSVSEVTVLQSKLTTLEQQQGWSLVSAAGTSITIAHKNELHLTFHPRSWITQSNKLHPEAPNSTVSLTYVGPEEDDSHPRSTVRRFFLQLLRAHALSLPQCKTRTSELLAVLRSGWDLASRVDAAQRALSVVGITEAAIQGDEKLELQYVLLLPTLQTKVNVRFTIDVVVNGAAVEGNVSVTTKAVYGEKYNEAKMANFVSEYVKGHVGSLGEVRKWAAGVEDLRAKLIKSGHKAC
jgi:kinetochore protein Spc7/SPC105